MSYSLYFEPVLRLVPLAALALAGCLPLALALYRQSRSAWLRLLTFGFFICLLLNPIMVKETSRPLSTIIAVVIDNSRSQNFGTRKQDTEQALAALKQRLGRLPQIEARFVQAARQDNNPDSDTLLATRLFTPLQEALADVPPARIGGAIIITDGQVADIPALSAADSAAALAEAPDEGNRGFAGAPDEGKSRLAARLGFDAPVNALISGNGQEYDRRLRFIKAPRFGLAGKEVPLSFTVQDEGAMPAGLPPPIIELFVNGEKQGSYPVRPGAETALTVTLPRTGSNIIELKTPEIEGEVTAVNNHAAIIIDGVRENLKVLLVSGEPHNGLRIWRDLLKSDTGVDLVHFTILRPPEKQDNTPIYQLSLIVFPTTDLFVNRLKDFDLVIFDRYQHYAVLPLAYYDYMARYVENGGALLMAVGPEFSGGRSLALTPLSRILPARPTGNIFEKPFLPQLTEAGRRHPVTQNLEGGATTPPKWGPWLRQIEVEADKDSMVLMQGVDKAPLMLLAAKGRGRVGMLLSDEGWLWARDYQGGGPYASLYRRMAHWLMKEPELEEENLTARAQGYTIFVERRTMKEGRPVPPPAAAAKDKTAPYSAPSASAANSPIGRFHITLPSGRTMEIQPQKAAEGLYKARFDSPETGLVRIGNGDKNVIVHAGVPNQPEYEDIISTPEKLAPVVAASGGHVLRLRPKAQDNVHIGAIKLLSAKAGLSTAAADSLVLRQSAARQPVAENRLPLMHNIWALLIGLGLLALAWWREGRA
ncbi:MAG: hypothetical protein DU430_00075 [Candidatus Tokpelaia sp.]|nr:MAG: hypothetical protein DU430_00075 [Candidatus Tokpelaia sp.]